MPLSTARLPFETTFTYPPEKCKDTKGAMKWSDAEVPEGAYSRFGKGSVGKFSIPFGEGVQDPASLLGSGRLGIMDSTVERLSRPFALAGGLVTLARYGGEAKEQDRDAGEPMGSLEELSRLIQSGRQFGSILMDPPWRFKNLTGKVGPEHRRLYRYPTMSLEEIAALPIDKLASSKSHLYLWCPNALLLEGLSIMKMWGFDYKTNIVWFKIRKDGGPDGRGVGFYFRNVTELVLFGSKGSLRTLKPGRTQVNIVIARKSEHSRKPEAVYDLIQRCSPGPYLELFARERVPGWVQWGDEVDTYRKKNPSQIQLKLSRN